MRASSLTRAASLACLVMAACGGGGADGSSAARSAGAASTPTASPAAIPAPRAAAAHPLLDWPEFGLDPQRSNVSERPTSITAANVGRLRRTTVRLPGTVDSSPIYLHGALVGGA